MARRFIHVAALASGLAALALAATVARPVEGRTAPRARDEAAIRDHDIAFYRARVGGDPRGATARAQLARLSLQRARQTGDHADLVRAEEAARRSVQLRGDRNGAGFAILASSLMGQHRFGEALGVAERLVALDGGSTAGRAMLGEIQLELGRYDEAARTFGTLAMHRFDPVVAPRYARWEELRGRPESARQLLRKARDAVRKLHGTPAEQLAWFQLRLGDLALRHGRFDEAGAELKAGLAAAPEDYQLLGAMARLELARERPGAAAAYGERAVARVLDPMTLGVLYDAHVASGDSASAEQYGKAMELAVLAQPGSMHRAWGMFLLDHGRAADTVLARAQAEILSRQDIYGWDLLAWALHHAGRDAEARQAMTRALALGTRDAGLHGHAGAISLALGDSAAAGRHFGEARAINPRWRAP